MDAPQTEREKSQNITRRPRVRDPHGTPFHGKRVAPDLLVWAVGALAEGLGMRAVARVFEVDPNTVLAWLVAVADHAAAFSGSVLDVEMN
jgi:hypothetical protein